MPRRPYIPKQPMTQVEALALAKLLVEFELENPQVEPPPIGWKTELREAKQVLGAMLAELHPLPQGAS